MSKYKIKINKIPSQNNEKNKSEIWAEITDLKNCTTMNKLIWWEDENGIYHDNTPNLPIDLREKIDNAWLEQKRRW